ncbi:MAG: AtpZ/AtpI family protein, partial [Acidimicrobiia bacterium]|nr:AtpZ/AtpI family protein [Acidimicrobiia bacterium]
MATTAANSKRARKPRWGKQPLRGDASGLTMGVEYVVAVLFFMGVGWLLDRWLGTAPWILVAFTVVGFVSGFLRLFYAEDYAKARRRTLGIAEPPQREVPEVLTEAAAAERERAPGRLFPGRDGDGIVGVDDRRPRRFGEPV